MKLIHLSDLHLGKRVNEFSMIEDQEYILKQILSIVKKEEPDAVLIAGDIYDKSVPSVEAVGLFDDFLKGLARRKPRVFIISGNHDSPERLSFAAELIELGGIHIAPVYNGVVKPVRLRDEYGSVNIYMLPFLKPAHVRSVFPEETVESYTDAVRVAVSHMELAESERNLLITHQFVTGAARSDSEELSAGGTDNVDGSVFDAFDYVALGHLHGPQSVGRETLRYCGSPLKYSFSEAAQIKSVTVLDWAEKGDLRIRTEALKPLRDLREIKGTYEELVNRKNYEGTRTDDYLHITLTDEEDVVDAMRKLQVIYPNLMKLDYDNRRTRENRAVIGGEEEGSKTPLELIRDFYEKQNNQAMSEKQEALVSELTESIWEESL
ncbi:MAG: exonuclease SbcCD subunit D [Roseburia sp.]|nr:exonuclease SbcCD subunit D [Roseburia sp.]MCM1097553.1 exonuclease SbcCD subunit D [Ruminococcus flavefaciens]